VPPTVRKLEAEAGDAGHTVQRFVHERLEVSNAEAKGLIASGCVRRNGRPVAKPDERLTPGDRVEVSAEKDRRYASAAHTTRAGDGWTVVHEDDDFLVVEKDPGVLTVPAAVPAGDSLEERLLDSYRKRGHRKPALHVVHRIDRYTSGLVVFARHHPAAQELKRQFLERSPERVYLAVAEGKVAAESGRLVHALAENPKSLKVYVPLKPSDGREAVSRYRVIERLPHATVLEVALETGRRNQIRVQFAAIGHPLVGDLAYGHPSPWIGRVALHAQRLAFTTPRGRKRVSFEAPVPADMKKLLTKLRAGALPATPGAPEGSVREEDEHARVREEVVRPAKGRDLRVAKEPEKRHARKVARQRR
jgi:23S rRNA pseudouridine1911/1915/1917 synthase